MGVAHDPFAWASPRDAIRPRIWGTRSACSELIHRMLPIGLTSSAGLVHGTHNMQRADQILMATDLAPWKTLHESIDLLILINLMKCRPP